MLAASVAYTIPASALAAATWFNTSVTLVPKLTLSWILSQIPRLVKASCAYCPAGTLAGSPNAMLSAFSMSSNFSSFFSFPVGTIRTILFSNRSVMVSEAIMPSSSRAVICFLAADMNTSASRPSSICVCSLPELS